MSNNRETSVEQYGRDLAAEEYPRAEQLPHVPAFRRKWIMRVRVALPLDQALEGAVRSIELSVQREVASAAGVAIDVVQPLTSITGIRLDDHHLILEIVSPSPSCPVNLGDASVIATFNTLRAADAQWELEDVQGIPKRYWFGLR